MNIQLISYMFCPFVHRSTIMLHEKQVGHEITYIDLANKPPWFLAISPRGKVPVLVADGEAFFESAAINEFLDETHPPPLLPRDPRERARQRAWIEVANDVLEAQRKIVTAASKEDYDSARAAVANPLGRFDRELKSPFFAGEAFSLVDAALAPALMRFTILEGASGVPLLEAFPGVDAWARRLAQRPSVVAGVVPTFAQLYTERMRKKGAYFAREYLDLAPPG